jgi:hypothetical protein
MFEVRDYIISRGIPSKNQTWAIEFARGCMYSCTFCDWSQNLTKKVKRRTHNWKDDIDLFWRLDVPIRETDANFGQWPDDIKAYDYAASLYDPSRNFSFIATNTPKLKKDVTEYLIFKNLSVYDDSRPTISMQDIDHKVLQAIQRPSVPWEKIVSLITNLRNCLPPEKFKKLTIETILGLPEQTVDGIVDAYVKLFELGVTNFSYYLWHMLDNSPAADPNYQKLWGLQVKEVWGLNSDSPQKILDLEAAYKNVASDDKNLDIFSSKPIVIGHRKMTTVDIWAVQIIKEKWRKLNEKENLVKKYTVSEIKKILVNLTITSIQEATEQYMIHEQYIKKYDTIIWGYYDVQEKMLYPNF